MITGAVTPNQTVVQDVAQALFVSHVVKILQDFTHLAATGILEGRRGLFKAGAGLGSDWRVVSALRHAPVGAILYVARLNLAHVAHILLKRLLLGLKIHLDAADDALDFRLTVVLEVLSPRRQLATVHVEEVVRERRSRAVVTKRRFTRHLENV